MQLVNNHPHKSLASSLFLLAGCFLLFEISFFVQCNAAYLENFNLIADHIQLPIIKLYPIVLTLIIQLILPFIYSLMIYGICQQFFATLNEQHYFQIGIGLWLTGMLMLLAAHQIYFPHSKFAELTTVFLPAAVAKGLFLLALIGVALLLIALLFQRTWTMVSLLGVMMLVMQGPQHVDSIRMQNQLPNIIIIGVDSLRPDHLKYFHAASSSMPFLDQQLQHASVFTQATTPLARTFPAWTALLTGQYPRDNGVRTNLASQQSLDLRQTLPRNLQRLGYTTVYASDETRFSNIDVNFGFDQRITAPIGLLDFLIGTFNDFPLSNLLVNSALGKWLFPYNYANRAAFVTYDPQAFVERVLKQLQPLNKQPIFLAIHLCLPHMPYLSQQSVPDLSIAKRYQAALSVADRQIKALLSGLRSQSWLKHAIVIYLSDHGEALGLEGDRLTEADHYQAHGHAMSHFWPKAQDHDAVNTSAGHGTDVLSFAQMHTLLALQFYGAAVTPQAINGYVSLLDIKPTVLALLQQPQQLKAGISLLPAILQHQRIAGRSFYFETDFSPAAIRSVQPNVHQALLQGINLFRVQPRDLRLIVKPEMMPLINASKQYAILKGDWLLALYPMQASVYQPVLVHLATGDWSDNLQSPLARRAHAERLLAELLRFQAKELSNITIA